MRQLVAQTGQFRFSFRNRSETYSSYKAQVLLPRLMVFNARCSVFGLKLVSNLPTARSSKRK
jgi:hypothetical protein